MGAHHSEVNDFLDPMVIVQSDPSASAGGPAFLRRSDFRGDLYGVAVILIALTAGDVTQDTDMPRSDRT